MKILLLGATGRTGKLLVREALQNGYDVKCLIREESKMLFDEDQEHLQIVRGNPLVKSDIERGLKDCDYVISVLNVSRESDFPWSKLRSPKKLMSDTLRNIVNLSHDHAIKKVVICSAWGVQETRNDIPTWFKWLIENSNIKYAYDDHERQEQILRGSLLKWTIVRPVGLLNGSKNQRVIETFDNSPKPSLTINRSSVAQYLVQALTENDLNFKTPVISGE